MFKPEYRVGFQVFKKEIGLWPTLKVIVPATFKSPRINYETEKNADEAERKKTEIKNHLKLMTLMYKELQKRFGTQRANEIMHNVVMEGGQAFLRGFRHLGSGQDLTDFVEIYKNFESHNVIFDVIEESDKKFETVIRRCLIYEALNEMGAGDLTQWMCDVATTYFQNYHPRIKYMKDRMIARGDDTCHEIFIWQG